MSPLRDRIQQEDGAIAVMAAVLASAMVLAGALAVDVGRVAYASRDQQGATDRGALDSVSVLRGFDHEASEATLDAVYDESMASLERNPRTATQQERHLYRVDLGRSNDPAGNTFELVCGGYFDGDGDRTGRAALVSAGILGDQGADDSATSQAVPPDCAGVEGSEIDAVRLWTYGAVDYVLAIGESGTDLHKIASARSTPPPDTEIEGTGTISAGSTLASMDRQVHVELLGAMVGDPSVDADLVGYQGIAEGRVRLGDLVATDELTVGSVGELLHTDVSVFDLVRATATVLEAEGNTASSELAAELEKLLVAESTTHIGPIRLGHSEEDVGGLDLGSGGAAGMDVRMDAVELVLASLQIANRDHALDLQLNVFGETLPVTLTVVEPPRIAEGPAGIGEGGAWLTQAENSQVELELAADLDALTDADSDLEDALEPVLDELASVIDDLLDLTCILGLCSNEIDLQTVDLVVRAAEGESGLSDVECEAEDGSLILDGGLTTETTVTSGRVLVEGDVFEVDGEVLRVTDDAQLTVGESDAESTHFEGPLPTGPTRVPASGSPLNGSLSAGDLQGSGDLSDVDDLVSPVTDLLEISLIGAEGIVTEVLDQLGLSLTSVDVLAHDVNCEKRTLQPSTNTS